MRRAFRCAFLVLMLLITTRVSAQTDSKQPSGVIAGRVTVADGPVSGVTVIVTTTSFQGAIAGRATTDDQGNYRITGLAAGEYSINPFAPAFYYPSSQFYGVGAKSVTLDEGEAVEGIDFKLTRGGVITGKVVDPAGKPVVEERVQLTHIDENRHGIPMPYNPNNFVTDDRGIYRIYGLEPGRYLVTAGRNVTPGFVSPGSSPRYYPLTYYPGVSEEARAEIVEVAPGGEAASVDIALGKTATGYSVRGRVVNSDTGQPVPGVMVGYGNIRPDGGIGAMGFSQNSQTDARGEFRIDAITPGRYAALAVPLNDGDFYSDQGPFDVTEGDVEGIQVVIHQGGSIAGVATVEGNVDPSIASKVSQLSLAARNLQNPPGILRPKPVAPDGSFRLTGLAPGKTMIYLANSGQTSGLSIARIELNGVDVAGGVEVGAGQQITGVRLVLSYGAGVIRGRVKIQGGNLPDSTPLMVSARDPTSPGPSSSKSARVDARGLFVIQGLADGEYELTLMVIGNAPGRRMQPLRQKVTVSLGTAAEAVFVLDLGGQN